MFERVVNDLADQRKTEVWMAGVGGVGRIATGAKIQSRTKERSGFQAGRRIEKGRKKDWLKVYLQNCHAGSQAYNTRK